MSRAVINKKGSEYNLLVEGYNLLAVMATPGVVGTKTTSNHIMEVQDVRTSSSLEELAARPALNEKPDHITYYSSCPCTHRP